MTRTSATAAIFALIMFAASHAALAQTGNSSPPPGTNSAGTAESSGRPLNSQAGVTTGSAGLGTGNANPPPTESTDTTIEKENKTIDSKLKGICRGC
jgi:hypothetical protein